jgi:hypothetical protein
LKSALPPIIAGLIISIIWGYFSDLREGDTQVFIIRLIVVPSLLLLFSKMREAREKERQESRNDLTKRGRRDDGKSARSSILNKKDKE